MPIERFTRADLTPAPWKNGRGITREIVRRPKESDMDGLDWRASLASIAADGPFSTFPGIDRVIVLIEGAGVLLRSSDGTLNHRLDTPLAPFGFAGEAEIACTLLAGASSDLNVLARRNTLRIETHTLREARFLGPSTRGLLFAARGAWQIRAPRPGFGSATVARDAGLWWDDEPIAWHVAPAEADAALIAIQLFPAPRGSA